MSYNLKQRIKNIFFTETDSTANDVGIKWSELKKTLGNANLTIEVDFKEETKYEGKHDVPKKLDNYTVINVLHYREGLYIRLHMIDEQN